jgi:hypothetical protein
MNEVLKIYDISEAGFAFSSGKEASTLVKPLDCAVFSHPLNHGVCRILFIKEYNVIVGIIYIELVPVTVYISLIVIVHREV